MVGPLVDSAFGASSSDISDLWSLAKPTWTPPNGEPLENSKTGRVGIPLSRFRDLLPARHGRIRTTSRPEVHGT